MFVDLGWYLVFGHRGWVFMHFAGDMLVYGGLEAHNAEFEGLCLWLI